MTSNQFVHTIFLLTCLGYLCLLSCSPDPKTSVATQPAKQQAQASAPAPDTQRQPIARTHPDKQPAAQVHNTEETSTVPQPEVSKKVNSKVSDANNDLQKKQPTKPATKPKSKSRAKPDIKFEKIRLEFDTIEQGAVKDFKFNFKNEGKAPLVIENAKATCGCTQPSYPFIPIEPGESGFIGVRYNSVGKEGSQKPLITITTNASQEPITLMLSGFVTKPEEEEKSTEETKVDSLK